MNTEYLKKIGMKEINDFKKTGEEFISGKISSTQFKGISGGMGVYAQRGGKKFMIRLRVLSGVIPFNTLKLIGDFTNDYSLKSIHLTTRQAVQLHDLEFDDVIDIMSKSLDNDLFTRGGGGNYPRNVSLSPLSGVEEEAFDVTPYAIAVNKYFISKMSSYHLPRKFKVAFSNNAKDTANASIADLGFLAINRDGKQYFKVYLGGSLGVNGDIALPYKDLVEPKDIFYHVEAILRLFVEEGDFENKGKARMRFMIKRMGKEKFMEAYEKILQMIKETISLDFYPEKNDDVKLEEISYESIDNVNLIPQKQKGYYTYILHPKGGLLDTQSLNRIISYLEELTLVQVRLSMEESMYIRHLTAEQAKHLLNLTKEISQITRLQQSICCIGVPTCQIGIGDSQGLLDNILSYFAEHNFTEDVFPSLHISGCLNSCARHQISEIGFQGKKKRVNDAPEDVYTLHIGGKIGENKTCLATDYADIPARRIPEFLYELALELKERQLEITEYITQCQEGFQLILNKYLV